MDFLTDLKNAATIEVNVHRAVVAVPIDPPRDIRRQRAVDVQIQIIRAQRIVRVRRWPIGDQICQPLSRRRAGQCHLCLVVCCTCSICRIQDKPGGCQSLCNGNLGFVVCRASGIAVVKDKLRQSCYFGRRQRARDEEKALNGANGLRIIADKRGDLVAV